MLCSTGVGCFCYSVFCIKMDFNVCRVLIIQKKRKGRDCFMVITNKYLWLLYNALSFLLYCFSYLMPRKKNRWVFGSWFGNQISDNSLAMYNYIKNNNPQLELIWLVRNPAKFSLDCKIIKRNSIKGMFYVATAKVAFVNQGYFDLCSFNFLKYFI